MYRKNLIFSKKSTHIAAYRNGFFWGIGNGLLGSTLVTFLLMDICGTRDFQKIGLPVAWIIAAPRLAGLFRMSAPFLIDHFGTRKWFCVILYLIAPMLLGGIPLLVPLLMEFHSVSVSIVAIVSIWCIYHLLEYLATTAFWSWFGDLVPAQIRGRFIAVRERWLLLGQILGIILVTQYMFFLNTTNLAQWEQYLVPALSGAVLLVLSAVPLITVPEVPWKKSDFNLKKRLRQIFLPMTNRRFLLFCFFGCWINIANGLTQSPQTIANKELFPPLVFGMIPPFLLVLFLINANRFGQFIISPRTGKLIDCFGNAPVMMICMAIVSSGSIFYFFATKSQPWWIVGAWIVWIFWVGVNIGISNLSLALTPREERTAYLAFYFAVTTAVLALATIGGGALFDLFRTTTFFIPGIHEKWSWSELSFLLSALFRFLSVFILWGIMRLEMKKTKDVNPGKIDTIKDV